MELGSAKTFSEVPFQQRYREKLEKIDVGMNQVFFLENNQLSIFIDMREKNLFAMIASISLIKSLLMIQSRVSPESLVVICEGLGKSKGRPTYHIFGYISDIIFCFPTKSESYLVCKFTMKLIAC